MHGTDDSASAGSKRKRSQPPNMKLYAVRVGRSPGIYHSWPDCLEQVRGYPKAVFKSFSTSTEARAFLSDDSVEINGAGGASGTRFYAVREGRVPGVYGSWPEVLEQITGWKNPKHRAFKTREEADRFMKEGNNGIPSAIPMVMGSGDNDTSDAADGPKTKKTKTSKKGGPNDSDVTAETGGEYQPGDAPLPPDAEDNFDAGITLDPTTGAARYKTAAEFAQTKYQAVGPAPQAPVRIYTDGSTLSNGQVDSIGGVGVYFGPKDRRNISEPLTGSKQTNQRAELTAILRALEVAPRDRRVIIISDSTYAIKCVTEWYPRWRANGWTNAAHRPVENRDLVQKVLELLDERVRLNKHRIVEDELEDEDEPRGPWEKGPAGVKFVWVKGHAKDEGNTAADELAVNGARTARELDEDVILD